MYVREKIGFSSVLKNQFYRTFYKYTIFPMPRRVRDTGRLKTG